MFHDYIQPFGSELEKFKFRLTLSISIELACQTKQFGIYYMGDIGREKIKRIGYLLKNKNVVLEFERNGKEKDMKIFCHMLILASINHHSLKEKFL